MFENNYTQKELQKQKNIVFALHTQADSLARSALNASFKKGFVEGRILGEGEKRKLFFFFKNDLYVSFFKRNKEKIKQNLRQRYREKIEIYRKMDIVFYDIEATNYNTRKCRSKEEMIILEKGIARLENLVNMMKGRKK